MISIELLVKEFYAILAMETYTLFPTFERFKHSHARWYSDLQEYKEAYSEHLAAMIFDYTVKVVAGELRHAAKKAEFFCPTFKPSEDRDNVYSEAVLYNPVSILETGEKVFSCEWENGYGGKKWAMIAHAGLLYKKINHISFIDHAVDLSHNNSVYFDKEADMFLLEDSSNYVEILNEKRDCAPFEVLQDSWSCTLFDLIVRAYRLGIIPYYIPCCKSKRKEEEIKKMLGYTPARYQNYPLKGIILSKHYKHEDEEREDDDEE